MASQTENMGQVKDRIKEQSMYHVVMHNDDFTTMAFVVGILMDIFGKNASTAERLMLQVHKEGQAIVGTYPYDIAVTLVRKASERARQERFPFRMTVEEA